MSEWWPFFVALNAVRLGPVGSYKPSPRPAGRVIAYFPVSALPPL